MEELNAPFMVPQIPVLCPSVGPQKGQRGFLFILVSILQSLPVLQAALLELMRRE